MSCMRAGDTREVVMPIQWLTVHQQLREFLLWLICKLQSDWCLCSWDLSNLSHQTLRWRMLANRYGASKNSSSQTFLKLGIVITRACSIHNSQCDFKTALKLNRYNNFNCLTLSSPFIYPKRLSPGEKKGTSKNYRWTLPNLFTSPFIYQNVCNQSAVGGALERGDLDRRRRLQPVWGDLIGGDGDLHLTLIGGDLENCLRGDLGLSGRRFGWEREMREREREKGFNWGYLGKRD